MDTGVEFMGDEVAYSDLSMVFDPIFHFVVSIFVGRRYDIRGMPGLSASALYWPRQMDAHICNVFCVRFCRMAIGFFCCFLLERQPQGDLGSRTLGCHTNDQGPIRLESFRQVFRRQLGEQLVFSFLRD